jgi:hypothetical protein
MDEWKTPRVDPLIHTNVTTTDLGNTNHDADNTFGVTVSIVATRSTFLLFPLE